MFRGDALTEAKGYDPAIMAGEEPELCHRLRERGWRVWCIVSPMTIHDADMQRPRQWWMRTVRSGFGYAQVWQKTRTGKGSRSTPASRSEERRVGKKCVSTC